MQPDLIFGDPAFWVAIAVAVGLVAYFGWSAKNDQAKQLKERIKHLEESQKEKQAPKI